MSGVHGPVSSLEDVAEMGQDTTQPHSHGYRFSLGDVHGKLNTMLC